MPISPWVINNLAPAWVISLVPDPSPPGQAQSYVNVSGLTASNFSLRMRNSQGTERTGAGAWSNITAAVTQGSGANLVVLSHASVTYQPAAADVNTLDQFTLWVDVTFSNGVESFLIGAWQVVPE